MLDTTLVIMAAGLGSRFGQGIKQLEPVGPSGEIIMDYSIYDALEAGFNKIVFILRREIEKDFREIIGSRVEKLCRVEYVFQSSTALPDGITCPTQRTKPWGTGQAILCCKDVVNEPFAIINADDYYGKCAFHDTHDFLIKNHNNPDRFCMAGFILRNTLSENGGVTRGICSVNEHGQLVRVTETKNIVKTADGAAKESNGQLTALDDGSFVSMNMWGASPVLFEQLQSGFTEFLKSPETDLIKDEYLIPAVIDKMVRSNQISVQILRSDDRWFGITYKEDKPTVVQAFKALVKNGVYPRSLAQTGSIAF